MSPTIPASSNFYYLILASGILILVYSQKIKAEYEEYIYSLFDEETMAANKFSEANLNWELTSKLLDDKEKEIEENVKNIKLALASNDPEAAEKILKVSDKNIIEIDSINKSFIKELEVYKNSLDNKSARRNAQRDMWELKYNHATFSSVIGILFVTLGFIGLSRENKKRSDILNSEHLTLKVTKEHCQSCGMKLLQDPNFDKESNYCSECFQEGEFREKIDFNTFSAKVAERMREKGFSEKEINKHLKKLKKFDRWNKTLDWN